MQIIFPVCILCIPYTVASTIFRRGKAVFDDTYVTIFANRKIYEIEYIDITKTALRNGRPGCYIIRLKNNRNIKIYAMEFKNFRIFDMILVDRVNKANKKNREALRLTTNWDTMFTP